MSPVDALLGPLGYLTLTKPLLGLLEPPPHRLLRAPEPRRRCRVTNLAGAGWRADWERRGSSQIRAPMISPPRRSGRAWRG